MKHHSLRICSPVIVLLAAACGLAAEATSPQRPNIVLVVADDHAQWATSLWGQPVILTPTLDALAATGIRMLDATSVSPVCSPSRASLLTGRLPSQHGVHDFIREQPGRSGRWLDGEILLPELLLRAGYRTALIGKWHLADSSMEPARGFERWLSYDVGPEGWQNQYRHRGRVYLSDQGSPVAVEGFQTARLVDAAIEWILGARDERPFFLLLAPTDTHAPHEGLPERWVSRYRKGVLVDMVKTPASLLPPASEATRAGDDLPALLAQYLASVSHQDAEIGRLVDALDATGARDRTLFVYTSDHGLMLGQKGLVGKGNATVPHNLYEESIRVPTVLHWPERFPRRNRYAIPFDHIDLFQTLLDAAKVELEPAVRTRINSPGASILPYLADPSTGWRTVRFAEFGKVRSMTNRRYKLVVRAPPLAPGVGDELYDLVEDPNESHNLIDSPAHRKTALELRAALSAHFARYEDPGRSGFAASDHLPQNGDQSAPQAMEASAGPR